jgi:hypothetical protein
LEHELARIVAVAALAAVHLLAGALRFGDGGRRSGWLSAAGGIAVAYVFVHLLPELGETQARSELPFLENHVYVLALVGFGVFYGVEMAAQRHAERSEVFVLSIASFTAYNGVIGYLLARDEFDLRGLVLFSVGMGLHFVVNDHSLREHHAAGYDRVGRFVVVAGIVAGWAVGQFTEVSEAAIGLMLAFIGGGVILNVIKEELPRERRSRFGAFALAAAAYSALLLAT